MRALQAVVIIMGVALVGGTVALAVIIVSRFAGDNHRHVALATATPGLPADIVLPAESKITEIAGVGDRLALHVVSPEGESIVIVDPATGAVIATLKIRHP